MLTKTELSRNRLLAGLPPAEFQRLLPHLQLVHFPLGRVVYESGQPIDYAYFPDDAVVSLLASLENGRSVEVTLIGNEGVLGVQAALGGGVAVNAAVAQIPGSSWKIKAAQLRSELQRNGVLHDLLLGYTL